MSNLVQLIYQTIKENPGINSYAIAKKLGVDYRKVDNVLPSLDYYGLLVSEDENTKLYPFDISELDNKFWKT